MKKRPKLDFWPLSFSKLGFWFYYYGDELCWMWPWRREILANGRKPVYISLLFEGGFTSLRDYWMAAGGLEEAYRSKKIQGSTMDELFYVWACNQSRGRSVVALKDINPIYKSASFWKVIPEDRRKELAKDYCVLYVDSVQEAKNLCLSVHQEFADAYVYSYEELICDNSEQP